MWDLPGTGIKPTSHALAEDSQTLDHQEIPIGWFCLFFFLISYQASIFKHIFTYLTFFKTQHSKN